MSYRIKSVASLTGINTATLRAWERRYSLVVPRRTAGGYRVYSDEDVNTIARVKTLVDRGLKVGEAVDIVRRGEPVPALPEAADSTEEIRSAMLEALLDFDRAAADGLYDRLAALSFPERIEEVLLPILREVGHCWERGAADVTQEHFLTAYVREKMEWMLGFLSSAPSHGEEAVFAGIPGERHEMGLLAVAVHLASLGWRVTYLGADVPLPDLTRTLAARRPALLCGSVVLAVSRTECLDLARRLRDSAPPGTRVVLGGTGIPEGVGEVSLRGVSLVPRLRDGMHLFAPVAAAG